MRYILSATLFALLCFSSLFALQPLQKATLWDHLVEVNVQWENQVPEHHHLDFSTAFATETERIRTHLLLVESYLRERPVDHLSPDQYGKRLEMLDQLHRYAAQGRFPQNHTLETRTPFFIDQYGTACAVGHLLIESGYEEFALQIKTERNNAYIAEMPYADLPNWAEAHGFAVEELAWIQPGYPMTEAVINLGNINANDKITFFKYDFTENRILIGGDFTEISGVPCNGFAIWDGNSISTLGNGLDGKIEDMINHQGQELYAIGNFANGGGSNVAVYRSGQWEFFQVGTGTAHALATLGGSVYVGGEMQQNGAYMVYTNALGASNFVSVGAGFDAPIEDLEQHQGAVYAAGSFQTNANTSTNYIARWDGTDWQDAGMGMDTSVYALGYGSNGEFLAGGILVDNWGLSMMGLSNWDGTNWVSKLNPNVFGVGSPGDKIERIEYDIYEDEVLLTGDMLVVFGLAFGMNAATYDTASQLLAPVCTPDEDIVGFTIWNGGFLFGGEFNYVNNTNIDYWGYRTISSSILDPAPLEISLFPNPTPAQFTIRSEQAFTEPSLVAFSLDGKRIPLQSEVNGKVITGFANTLATGTYLLMVQDLDRVIWTTKLQVE